MPTRLTSQPHSMATLTPVSSNESVSTPSGETNIVIGNLNLAASSYHFAVYHTGRARRSMGMCSILSPPVVNLRDLQVILGIHTREPSNCGSVQSASSSVFPRLEVGGIVFAPDQLLTLEGPGLRRHGICKHCGITVSACNFSTRPRTV